MDSRDLSLSFLRCFSSPSEFSSIGSMSLLIFSSFSFYLRSSLRWRLRSDSAFSSATRFLIAARLLSPLFHASGSDYFIGFGVTRFYWRFYFFTLFSLSMSLLLFFYCGVVVSIIIYTGSGSYPGVSNIGASILGTIFFFYVWSNGSIFFSVKSLK